MDEPRLEIEEYLKQNTIPERKATKIFADEQGRMRLDPRDVTGLLLPFGLTHGYSYLKARNEYQSFGVVMGFDGEDFKPGQKQND